MSPAQNFSERQFESQWCPDCGICKESVNLEESKTDEYGQAIHEECYVSKLTRKSRESISLRSDAQTGRTLNWPASRLWGNELDNRSKTCLNGSFRESYEQHG